MNCGPSVIAVGVCGTTFGILVTSRRHEPKRSDILVLLYSKFKLRMSLNRGYVEPWKRLASRPEYGNATPHLQNLAHGISKLAISKTVLTVLTFLQSII